MRVGYLVIVPFIVFLSSCTPATKMTSDTSNNPAQSLEDLRRKCLTEAEWDSNRYAQTYPVHVRHQVRDSVQTKETSHLKSLCHDLSSPPDNASSDEFDESLTKATSWRSSMEQACDKEIKEHTNAEMKGKSKHLERYSNICRKMIDLAQPIN